MRNQRTAPMRRSAGFTLIELLVAMGITLIISLSIYALVNTAQAQFVKQPAVSGMQQNLRASMDMITNDVLEAGDGLAPFVQAFSPNLSGKGPAGSLTGANSDILEIVSNPRNCPPMYVSTNGTDYANVGNEIDTMTPSPAAPPTCWSQAMPSLVYVYGPGGTPAPAPVPVTGASPIPGLLYATTNGTAGKQLFASTGVNTPGGLNPAALTCPTPGVLGTCVTMTIAQLIRYQLAPDPADGVMSLWRSTQGALAGPPPAVVNPPAGPWQMVARGIDDFQITYEYEGGAPTPGVYIQNRNAPVVQVPLVLPMPSPPTVPAPETCFASLVRRVRITIVGYAPETVLAQGQIGQGTTVWTAGLPSPLSQPAIRSQLISSVSPRAALVTLALDTAAGHWN
jgi:prepilin-type N-terminal cleavage/methylation domain-containing protein